MTMRFGWDDEKNDRNQKRHGISFNVAALVFGDPNLVLLKDRIDEETGEQRWHGIGLANAAVLFVVHVYRRASNDHQNEEIIRIISAREANQRECRIYFQS